MNGVLVTYSNSEYYFAGGIFDGGPEKLKKSLKVRIKV